MHLCSVAAPCIACLEVSCSLSWASLHQRPPRQSYSSALSSASLLLQDLYEAIGAGDYPEWKLCIQTMEVKDEDKFDFDPLVSIETCWTAALHVFCTRGFASSVCCTISLLASSVCCTISLLVSKHPLWAGACHPVSVLRSRPALRLSSPSQNH